MSKKAEIMKAVGKCKDRHTLYTCPHETEPYIGLSDLEAILDKHLPEPVQGVEEWIEDNIFKAYREDDTRFPEQDTVFVKDLRQYLSTLPLLPEGYVAVPKEPTWNMKIEGLKYMPRTDSDEMDTRAVYKAMLQEAEQNDTTS